MLPTGSQLLFNAAAIRQACKPVSALPPRMGPILSWPEFSSVARPLLSHGLGKHPQPTLVRPLVHASGLDRHRAARSPFEASSQFLYTTRRAVHRWPMAD